MNSQRKLGAIILAAGKGTRMKSGKINKVALLLADKPLILHSIHLLELMKFKQIVVVVGFAKESVKSVLLNSKVNFVEQKKRMGTAHAVKKAIEVIDDDITDILVIQGDDSHFYNKKIIGEMITAHNISPSSLTFLTINADNPFGLGRIVRSKHGKIVSIIEEKDADEKIKKIKEVNPACYIFDVGFLKKFIGSVPRSTITGEYYLTSLINIALSNKKIVKAVPAGNVVWRGVNTKEELLEAERLYKKIIG